MKNGWPQKKLAEVILDIKDGGTPSRKNPEYFGGDVYWCVVKDIKPLIFDTAEKLTQEGLNNCSAKVWPVDSVIISLGATIGQIGIAKVPTATKQGLAGIVVNKQMMTPEFLAYGLLDQKEYIQSIATGATIREIRPTRFAETIKLLVPPLPEQQRIVRLLDEAFAGITTAQANAEKNLQNARALFESHLQSVFTQRGKGWVEKKLGDENLLEIIDGDRGVNYPNGSDFQDEGYCLFMNTKNVRPDGFVFESTMFITKEKDGQLRKGKLKRDDVVLTTRGTIGNVGIYDEDVPFDNIRINSGMLIFRPNTRALLPSYLFELFRSEIMKEQIKKQTTGAAQPQLPIKTLVNFTIPVPTNLDDQRTLVKKLRAFEPETQRLTSLYERKLAALEALKKSLLHQAFTGNL